MRCIAALFVLAVLASCREDGINIEIHVADTGATRVELYLVDDYCRSPADSDTKCTLMKTPSSASYLTGEVYTRLTGDRLSAAVDSSGVATFTIYPDGKLERVDFAVAVGVTGPETAATPVGGIRLAGFTFADETERGTRRIATLVDVLAPKVDKQGQSAPGLRIETWYGATTNCVAYQHTRDGSPEELFFIVPKDDPDCDDYLADDCEMFWPDHMASDPSGVEHTCVADLRDAPACLMGNAKCSDGEGPRECREESSSNDPAHEYCVPTDVCNRCRGSSDSVCAYAALKSPGMTATRIVCDLEVRAESGAYKTCTGGSATGNVSTAFTVSNASCEGLTIAKIIGPALPFGMAATHGGATMSVDLDPGCVPKLTFEGSLPVNGTARENAIPDLVARLQLDNAYALVVPLKLNLIEAPLQCMTNAMSCRVAPPGLDPSLAACASR